MGSIPGQIRPLEKNIGSNVARVQTTEAEGIPQQSTGCEGAYLNFDNEISGRYRKRNRLIDPLALRPRPEEEEGFEA